MGKCAIAILDETVQDLPPVWAYEARRLLEGDADRILIKFNRDDLLSCRLDRDLGVELFERVAIERWGAALLD